MTTMRQMIHLTAYQAGSISLTDGSHSIPMEVKLSGPAEVNKGACLIVATPLLCFPACVIAWGCLPHYIGFTSQLDPGA